jgi:hypothetical protein
VPKADIPRLIRSPCPHEEESRSVIRRAHKFGKQRVRPARAAGNEAGQGGVEMAVERERAHILGWAEGLTAQTQWSSGAIRH